MIKHTVSPKTRHARHRHMVAQYGSNGLTALSHSTCHSIPLTSLLVSVLHIPIRHSRRRWPLHASHARMPHGHTRRAPCSQGFDFSPYHQTLTIYSCLHSRTGGNGRLCPFAIHGLLVSVSLHPARRHGRSRRRSRHTHHARGIRITHYHDLLHQPHLRLSERSTEPANRVDRTVRVSNWRAGRRPLGVRAHPMVGASYLP